MELPNFNLKKRGRSKISGKNMMKMPLLEEMERTGVGHGTKSTLLLGGVAMWAVLIWLFVDRLKKIDDSATVDNDIRNVTIIILSFHIITMFFTLLETRLLSSNMWIAWATIGLGSAATFLNVASVGSVLSGSPTYDNPNYNYDVGSVIIQSFANAIMLAYIIRLIRTKNKFMY